MAPEQAKGELLNARSDLFSVGIVLYQMVTGILPFQGKHRPAVLLAVTSHEPRPPIDLEPSLPPELDSLIRRLLAKAPAAPPGSARETADELESIEANLPGSSASNVIPPSPSGIQPPAAGEPGHAASAY